MAYAVKITFRAERDLAHLYEELGVQHSNTALTWYSGLRNAIFSLEKNPNRCPVTRENRKLRHLLYTSRSHVYRILFNVDGRTVNVIHIRHGRRRPLTGD